MDELKIISWNCNGIGNKILELTAFVQKNKIDIILRGETRLNPKNKISIPNYHVYRTDRPKTPTAPSSGGTAILIRKKYNPPARHATNHCGVYHNTIKTQKQNNANHSSIQKS